MKRPLVAVPGRPSPGTAERRRGRPSVSRKGSEPRVEAGGGAAAGVPAPHRAVRPRGGTAPDHTTAGTRRPGQQDP